MPADVLISVPLSTVVFRADASPSIGGGHVMRCLALADVLTRRGSVCYFACGPETAASVPALRQSPHHFMELSHANPELLTDELPDGCDWLVVDHYQHDAAFEARCRPWAHKIMVIDDLANRPHDCDLLLDQTLGRPITAYDSLVPAGADVLTGSDYTLLRPEFAAVRDASLAARRNGRLRRVLVSVGLTDPANATETVLEGIIESLLEVEVDVVLGPSAANLAKIRSIIERNRLMKLYVGTDAVAQLASEADFCFGAAGMSAWERCCVGLPSALLVVADNQIENTERLVAAGAAFPLGLASELAPSKVAEMLLSIERQPQLLSGLAAKAASICDGRGTQRVAMRLNPVRTRNGEAVWLRSATAGDVDLTYAWQCQPETRRFGRNSAVPTRPEHEAWFAARLHNPESLLSVIICDDEPVGTLRLDRQGSSTYEVSIVVSSACYGRGLGLAALELARWLVPEAEIRAEILPGNVRSEALFTKAGYLPQGYGWRSIAALEQKAHSPSETSSVKLA